MPEEVFISYGSADRDRIQDLVSRLRQAGVTVWIDEAGIEGSLLGALHHKALSAEVHLGPVSGAIVHQGQPVGGLLHLTGTPAEELRKGACQIKTAVNLQRYFTFSMPLPTFKSTGEIAKEFEAKESEDRLLEALLITEATKVPILPLADC